MLALLMSILTFKSGRAQTLSKGVPLILIQDGYAIEASMHSERINLDDTC